MEVKSNYDNIFERYLLGELSESECRQVEEAYFADDSLFARFLAVKEDLLDAYARGELVGNKLKCFEQHYLATEPRRQRVDEMRDLIQAASGIANVTKAESTYLAKTHRSSWWQWFPKNLFLYPAAVRVALVAGLLLILTGGWLVMRQLQRSTTQEQAHIPATRVNENSGIAKPPEGSTSTENANLSGDRTTANPSPSPLPKPEIAAKPLRQTHIASITLQPISTRDAGNRDPIILSPEPQAGTPGTPRAPNAVTRTPTEPLTLSSQVGIIRLNLAFGGGHYDSFEASVSSVDGDMIVRRRGLKARPNEIGKLVTITFDASLVVKHLSVGQIRQGYIVTLRGFTRKAQPETIAEYYFRVNYTTP